MIIRENIFTFFTDHTHSKIFFSGPFQVPPGRSILVGEFKYSLSGMIYLDKRGGGNINHGAHMWGAVYGLLFTIAFITAMGHLNLIDNFKEQLQASNPFIPVGCGTDN